MYEADVRRLLSIDSEHRILEVGVFRPPPVDLAGHVALGGLPEGEELAISEEWLSDDDLQAHFSNAPRLSALLPGVRVKRLDIDPRILTFEDLPAPAATHGRVTQMSDGHWALDSRAEPAVIVIRRDRRDVVIWGESSEVRVFLLRRAGEQ